MGVDFSAALDSAAFDSVLGEVLVTDFSILPRTRSVLSSVNSILILDLSSRPGSSPSRTNAELVSWMSKFGENARLLPVEGSAVDEENWFNSSSTRKMSEGKAEVGVCKREKNDISIV